MVDQAKSRTAANISEAVVGTRAKLIEAARLCLLEDGAAATSVKTIAQRAGVNHGLVHHYFGSKEALMIEVLKRIHFDLPELAGDDVDADVRAIEQTIFRDERVALELVTLSFQMPRLREAMDARTTQVMQSYRKRFPDRAEHELVQFGACILGLAVYHGIDTKVATREALRDLLLKFLKY